MALALFSVLLKVAAAESTGSAALPAASVAPTRNAPSRREAPFVDLGAAEHQLGCPGLSADHGRPRCPGWIRSALRLGDALRLDPFLVAVL